MARKRFSPEQIITMLREAEVLLNQSTPVAEVCRKLGVSERLACRAIGQPRSTQRHKPKVPEDEERLVSQIIKLATEYGRYGYRRITALLRPDGWRVNNKRIERLWRRVGLKVQQKQSKRGR